MADELTIDFTRMRPVAGTEYEFAFRLRAQTRRRQVIASVSVELSDFVARTKLVELTNSGEALNELLLRWSVRRLERALADPVTRKELEDQTVRWRIDDPGGGEVEELLALAVEDKTCRYQRAEGPDLLCLAAGVQDETMFEQAIGTIGRHLVAPTSRLLCDGCGLPDASVVCSQLSHPQVTSTAMGPRELRSALCNLGRTEVERPGDCRPGGNPCWQRTVRLEPSAPPAAGHPLILAEVLDSLDAWWRLSVAKKPLLRLKGAAAISGLTQSCTSRSEFTDRLSALTVVLGNLLVDDGLVQPHLVEDEDLPSPDQSVKRLRICLGARITDADGKARVNQALDRLARLKRIRNTLQHGSHGELAKLTAALGLAWPPTDWSAAWEQVRAEAVDAFRKLRDELRELAETAT